MTLYIATVHGTIGAYYQCHACFCTIYTESVYRMNTTQLFLQADLPLQTEFVSVETIHTERFPQTECQYAPVVS